MSKINEKLYIEKKGKSGIWEYTKYTDGTAICKGIYEWNCTGWEAWGNVYTSKANGNNNYAIPPDFPFEFTEIPHLTVESVGSGTNNIIAIQQTSGGATTTTPSGVKYVRPASGGTSGKFSTSYLAIGKWK